MKKILELSLVLSLTISILTGCVATTAAVAGAAGGAMVSDPRSTETMINDQDMSHQAAMKISENKIVAKQSNINIATYDGVVLVTGQAPTDELRTQAINTIKAVPNIKMIYNEIQITEPTTGLIRANDAWLTTKVKSQLLSTKQLHSNDFKVVTENGVVYLLGIVSADQGQLAVRAANQIAGVKRVIPLFQLKQISAPVNTAQLNNDLESRPATTAALNDDQ